MMAKLVAGILFVILPLVFSAPAEEKQARSLPIVGGPSSVAATGALGANYGQQTASSENHDKKNFGLNYSSDRGNSNQYSNTGVQAAATGGLAQGIGYPSYPQYQYQPYYPSAYPYYPAYPNYGYPNYGYPNVGVPNVGIPNVGVPNVGVGSGVQLPNLSAGSVAGVGQGVIRY